ncbi:hypothetical protein [Thomasclavelia cocleata]|nr:hypothetical protein [Thomasclavelia cocleata]
MKNKLEELKIELNQTVQDTNCSINEILEISNKIDKEIERVYWGNYD